MTIVEDILAEFGQEVKSTRQHLERIPEELFDWQPHEKSMTFRQLGSHIAESFDWVDSMLQQDVMEFDPAEWTPYVATDRADMLAKFDKGVATARDVLEGQPDEHMLKRWTLKMGGEVVLNEPRGAMVRNFMINHHVHHRAQLGVYLRLKDVPVPQTYGPSSDETDMCQPPEKD